MHCRYSIASRSSFENLDKWTHEVRHHVGRNVKVVLVGSKADLTLQREVRAFNLHVNINNKMAHWCNSPLIVTSCVHQVQYGEGLDYARRHGFHFFEVSALTQANVKVLFDDIARFALSKTTPEDTPAKNGWWCLPSAVGWRFSDVSVNGISCLREYFN